jgi:hypothetical protein
MSSKQSTPSSVGTSALSRLNTNVRKERGFLIIIIGLLILSGLVFKNPTLAMWLAFLLAGYSAIANDSIQTIGTFISSNGNKPWYWLWLFMGTILVLTLSYSFIVNDGDVSYQRLNTPGLDIAPATFEFLQVAAPIILLILTRLRMPVSTSILLLSAFSTKSSSIGSILMKSFTGYILAFFVGIIVWALVSRWIERKVKNKAAGKWWTPFQWVTSGTLWAVWIMQDVSNIAVVLPRQLEMWEFGIMTGYLFAGLGVLFYLKGDKIQGIVNEKADVTDVRAATIVDIVYAALLFYLKVISTIPISTTWVFLGLLGGREIAINMMKTNPARRVKGIQRALMLVRKDALYAGIGLLVSIILAFSINDAMRAEMIELIWPD